MKKLLRRLTFILISLSFVGCSKKGDTEPALFDHYQSDIFNENLTNDIVVDSKNNKWITSYAGLLKYDNQKWIAYTMTSSNAPSDTLFNIAIDSKDNIYCLTMSQKIVRFDGSSWLTLNNKNICGPTSLCVDHNDNLWIAAYYGLYRFDGTQWTSFQTTLRTTYTNNWANAMTADNNNAIWIACESGGLVKFDGITWTTFTVNQDVPNGVYRSVCVDNTGIIWVGALGAGAFKNQGNSFAVLKRDEMPSLCNTINSIGFDKNQNCWLGTEKGLLKYDGSAWTSFLEDDYSTGIPIKSIAIDHNNDIWAATSNGVYKIFNRLE
jgi:ligand-binding sensor domain-containing protein